MYGEWLGIGRRLGVHDGDLPETWNEFRAYFDRMVAERLEDNDVVHGVLSVLSRPKPPPIPLLGDPAWRVASLPLARAGAVAMKGLLPPTLRQRFGLNWSRARELELNALAAASRAAGALLPSRLRRFGPAYLEWRREAIDRGGMAAIAPRRGAAA